MASVKFFLKYKDKQKSPLNCIVSFMGKQYPISVKTTVVTRFWNPKKYRCKKDREYKEAEVINERLEMWEQLLSTTAKQFEAKILAPELSVFKEAVAAELNKDSEKPGGGLVDFAIKHRAECSKSLWTKKKYGVTIKHLQDYEHATRKKIQFGDVNYGFYNLFRSYLLNKTFEVAGEKKQYAKNAVGSILQNTLVFFNEARRAGLHDNTVKDFKIDSEEVDTMYLSTDELIRLHRLEITPEVLSEKFGEIDRESNLSRRIQSLIDNKDRFLIGAFTAMRFGDYSGLSELRSTDQFISKRTSKTGAKVIIPMHWVIKEILERRDNRLPAPISNQKLNDALKELGKLAGFDDIIEQTVTRGGRKETTRRAKWELFCTHTARRSGCTNMYLAGIDIYTIMGFSGHTTERSFRKYIKIKQEENAKRFVDHPFFNKPK